MEQSDTVRFIKGLMKKHGKEFSLVLRYRAVTGKIRRRHGEFVDLLEDRELVLFNREKGTEGRYELARIEGIRKK